MFYVSRSKMLSITTATVKTRIKTFVQGMTLRQDVWYDRVMKKYTQIDDILNDLAPEKRQKVELLRQIILESTDVTEHVKWNAPSYIYNDEDRITFNLYGEVKILIHMGATRKEDKKATPIMDDPDHIISWNSDIRGTITFSNLEDIEVKREAFVSVIQRWLALS